MLPFSISENQFSNAQQFSNICEETIFCIKEFQLKICFEKDARDQILYLDKQNSFENSRGQNHHPFSLYPSICSLMTENRSCDCGIDFNICFSTIPDLKINHQNFSTILKKIETKNYRIDQEVYKFFATVCTNFWVSIICDDTLWLCIQSFHLFG